MQTQELVSQMENTYNNIFFLKLKLSCSISLDHSVSIICLINDQLILGADNLIPMELALKIATKIRAKERFAVYIVIPMWPEGVPSSGAVQEILFWQVKSGKLRNEFVQVGGLTKFAAKFIILEPFLYIQKIFECFCVS